MLTIATKFKSWALMAWAVFLVLIGAYAWGSRAAKKAAQTKDEHNEALRAAAGAKGVHDAELETDKLPTGSAADQLERDWMRDDHPAAPHADPKGDSGDAT